MFGFFVRGDPDQCLSVSRADAMLTEPGSHLRPRVEAELGQDVLHVSGHRFRTERQLSGDCSIRKAFSDEMRYLKLTSRHLQRRVDLRPGPCAAWHPRETPCGLLHP